MEDNKKDNFRMNFPNLLILILSLSLLFFSILRIALKRVHVVYKDYTTIQDIFFNGFSSLIIWTLILVFPIIIVFLIAIYSRIRISFLVGFISLILSSIFLFSAHQLIFDKPKMPGTFILPSYDIVGPLGALMIIFPAVLLLSTLIFYIYKKENLKISAIALIITIIFFPLTIYNIYQESIDLEDYWVAKECSSLRSYISVIIEPETEISKHPSSPNLSPYVRERYSNIARDWGDRCREEFRDAFLDEQWFEDERLNFTKEDIKIEKEKLRNWVLEIS